MHRTCHTCPCRDHNHRPYAVSNPVHERALSASDVGHTYEYTLANRGVGAPNTRPERVWYRVSWRSGLLCPWLSSSQRPPSTGLRRHGVPSSIRRAGYLRSEGERAGHYPREGRRVPSWICRRTPHPSTHGARSCCGRHRLEKTVWQSEVGSLASLSAGPATRWLAPGIPAEAGVLAGTSADGLRPGRGSISRDACGLPRVSQQPPGRN